MSGTILVITNALKPSHQSPTIDLIPGFEWKECMADLPKTFSF